MSDQPTVLPYADLPAQRRWAGTPWFIAAMLVALFGHGVSIRAAASLWRFAPGSTIRPMGEAAMMLLGGLFTMVIGGGLVVAGFAGGDRRRRSIGMGIVAGLLVATPCVTGRIVWDYVEWGRGLIMAP